MTIDYTGPEGGRLAMGFAGGCVSAWVFVRNLVMKPAIKSCRQQIDDLRQCIEEIRAERQRERDEWREERVLFRRRIDQLETILMTTGPAEMRKATQAALSENHVAIKALELKIKGGAA